MTAVVGYRLADWDTPLWVNPNRSPSRWRVSGMIVQYWSLHPLTPWAEFLRNLDLRDPAEAGEVLLRPWVAELSLPDDTIELSFETSTALGLDPEALVDDRWTRCQVWVAERRPSALVVPSAALPGTSNVVLYGARVRSRYGVAPIDPAVDVPCDPVAASGDVVQDLLRSIRWRGEPHAGLQAWRSGVDQPGPPSVRTYSQ